MILVSIFSASRQRGDNMWKFLNMLFIKIKNLNELL